MPAGTTHGDGGHLDGTKTHRSACTFRDGPHAEQREAGRARGSREGLAGEEEGAMLQLHANSRQTRKQTARGTVRT